MTIPTLVPCRRCSRGVVHLVAALASMSTAVAVSTAAAAATEGVSSDLTYPIFVREAAQRFGIPESWIRAVMHAESGGNPHAVSAAGAMGLMQVMPATWGELAVRYRLGGDPFDVRANILAGTAYLRAMLDRYGDLDAALAAYNAGPARVDAWQSGQASLPSETVSYVARIAPSLIGIGGMTGIPMAPVIPDWRSSALFDVLAGKSAIVPPSLQPDDNHGAAANAGSRANVPSSNGLFIALSEHGS